MPPQTALISLLIAAAAAAVAFGAWYVWRDEAGPPVVGRRVTDLVLPYRCERGHLFNALGEVEPLSCPQCGATAYAITEYICPVHGQSDVAVQFELDAYGEAFVTKMRVEGGDWVDVDAGLRCPRCGQALYREQGNPLAHLGEAPREGEIPRRPPIPPSEQPRPQPGPPNEPKPPIP